MLGRKSRQSTTKGKKKGRDEKLTRHSLLGRSPRDREQQKAVQLTKTRKDEDHTNDEKGKKSAKKEAFPTEENGVS